MRGANPAMLMFVFAVGACVESPPPAPDTLPWQIRVEDGRSRVFGITLGETSLREAVGVLGKRYELAMFGLPEAAPVLEVFYREVSLSGLTGKLILTLDMPEEMLHAMRGRSPDDRILNQGRERRWQVADEDLEAVMAATVRTISYIPRVNLEEAVAAARFGEPARRIAAADGGMHWLYPALGLDLLLDPDGRELLQYVSPAEFDRLTGPLESGMDPSASAHTRR
jgi:hypothetical protein